MKKLLIYLLSATILFAAGCSEPYDDSVLIGRVDNLENRVAKLEELCKQMNTNISSLQTLINALQNNDYVTGVTPITKDGETIGYTITFTKSKPITIYHGEDGKAGVNGTDGQDGHTPIIGVKQDTDGIYYWTLDGDWLLDDNGDKIKAQGTDGKDGENGEDGKDGVDGTDGKDGVDGVDGTDGEDGEDGKDGITPQLKIENDYWYISYDNGKTWIQLGKAKGDDGQNGDNIFNNVTYDNDNVYFELNDGTVITLSRGMNLTSIIKDIVYIPTHSDNKISVNYYGSGLEGSSNATVDFIISPKNITAQISKDNLKVFATKTQTRLAELIELEIRSYSIDKKQGVLTIDIDCSSFDEAFYTGDISYSIALCVVDDIGEVWSEFTTAVPVCHYPASNEVWYSSTDNKIIIPYDVNKFGANIVSNTYERGRGVILFDGDVLEVGTYAFRDRKQLAGIVFPKSVLSFGGSVFAGCTSLKKICIPENVASIGATNIFSDCINLKIIEGKYASEDRRCIIMDGILKSFAPADLKEYIIPSGVKSIGSYAFWGASSLEKLTIPNGVTSIGLCAFGGCAYLKDIIIPESVDIITGNAFSGCRSLEELTIPDGVTQIDSYTFHGCTNLKKIILPQSIVKVGSYAFYDCKSLESIDVPDGVTAIGSSAFSGCTSLKSFNMPQGVTTIKENIFINCPNLSKIRGKYTSNDERCIIIDGKLLSFASAGLNEYTIPNEVEIIGSYSFAECGNLRGVTIPNNVVTIEGCAFSQCENLERVDIQEGVKTIGQLAFMRCINLKSISIPKSVIDIKNDVFINCKNLKSVYCNNENPPSLGQNVFKTLQEGIYEKIGCFIYVPESSINSYKTALGWKDYVEYIISYNFSL